jgi:hypothetical protein
MKKTLLAMLLVTLLPGMASAGMKVKSESRPGVDLTAYSSYSWKAADPATSGLMIAEGTKLAKALEEVGDGEMAKVGLNKRPSGESELIFRYRGFARDMVGVAGGGADPNPDVNWIVGGGASSMAYKKGTLLVEAVDAESGELLWAGWASDVIEAFPKREKVARKAEKAMRKTMKEFAKK